MNISSLLVFGNKIFGIDHNRQHKTKAKVYLIIKCITYHELIDPLHLSLTLLIAPIKLDTISW